MIEQGTLFLIALGIFGVGFCIDHFYGRNPAAPYTASGNLVAIAAGVMGVLAFIDLLK